LNKRPVNVSVRPMSKFNASDVLELPISERLRLVEDIWNTIVDAPLELTEEDKRLIDQRLEACRLNPNVVSSLEEVFARITARKK
jgi:putative addiction module component (TIGR02574 family)